MIVKYSVMQQDRPKDYAALCEVNEDGLQLLRLMGINPELAKEARKVLDVNKQERHIRGGMATKEKYLHACAR